MFIHILFYNNNFKLSNEFIKNKIKLSNENLFIINLIKVSIQISIIYTNLKHQQKVVHISKFILITFI